MKRYVVVIVTVSVNVRCYGFNIQPKSHGILSQRRQFRFQRCPSWNLCLSACRWKIPSQLYFSMRLGLSLWSCRRTTHSTPRNNDGEEWHSARVHVPSTVYRIRQTSHVCDTTRVTRPRTMRMSITLAVTNRSKWRCWWKWISVPKGNW